MRGQWRIIVSAVLLAFVASAAGAPGAYEHYRFMTRPELQDTEALEVKKAIKFFSASLAGFYAIGGTMPEGLNLFPAEKMVKRRIFHDINTWRDESKLLVMDRDKSAVKDVRFIAPDRAIAVVEENWFNQFQDSSTRRPISGKKADFITVRYFLKKAGGLWIVVEYEVHQQGERLPFFPPERFAKW